MSCVAVLEVREKKANNIITPPALKHINDKKSNSLFSLWQIVHYQIHLSLTICHARKSHLVLLLAEVEIQFVFRRKYKSFWQQRKYLHKLPTNLYDIIQIFDFKSNILRAIAVLHQVISNHRIVWIVCRNEHENNLKMQSNNTLFSLVSIVEMEFLLRISNLATNSNEHWNCRSAYFILFHHVLSELAIACLQTLICQRFEAQSGCVVAGCLLCIAHIKCNVIKCNELSTSWLKYSNRMKRTNAAK